MTELQKAAERTVAQALRLRPGESFLLVTDTPKLEIAEAVAFQAREAGAETTTYLMTETLRPIGAPTKLFRRLIEGADAVLYMLDARIEEKPFRGYMVKAGTKSSRICMMPGITREMMGRLVNIDYAAMGAFAKKVIRKVKDAGRVEVENPAGTKISFSVKGRPWHNDDGDIGSKGKHGNLPAGECYTAPVEDTFTGRLAISLIDDKIGRGIMDFERGKLVGWKGRGIEAIVANIAGDPTGMIIGEFGIGTNRAARVCSNMLEAEKAFGTVHFALGDSYGLGKNASKHHYDALVDKATIRVNGREIARNGHYLI
jgi:leucyl aminopeptidase (aminopeptidase T)